MNTYSLRETLSDANGQISTSAHGFRAWLAEKIDLTLSRPQAVSGIVVSQLTSREGSYYILKNPETRTYFRLSDKEYFLWQRMDGNHTVKELVVAYFMEFKVLAFGRVGNLLAGLKNNYFLIEQPVNVYQQIKTQLDHRNPQVRLTGLLKAFIEKQIAFNGLDKSLTSFYKHVAWLFFTPFAQILWLLVSIAGLVCFSQIVTRVGYNLVSINGNIWLGTLSLILAYSFSVFIHEMSHALAVTHYGREVSRGGLMIYYGMPAYFVDTSDIWMEGKRARLAVTWAGPYSGLILAGLASLALFLWPQFLLNPVLFQFASLSYILVLLNLNPLLELDGYFLLMDGLEIPSLRRKSLEYIRFGIWQKVKALRTASKQMRQWLGEFSREERIFAVFGLLSALWSVYSIAEAIVIWQRRINSTVRPIFMQSGATVRVAILVAGALLGLILLIGLGVALIGTIRRAVTLATRAGFFATPWRKAAWILALIVCLGIACLVFPPASPWIGLAALTLASYFAWRNARDYSGSRFAPVFWLMSATCLIFWFAEVGKLLSGWNLAGTNLLDVITAWISRIALIILALAGLLLLSGTGLRQLSARGKISQALGIFGSLALMITIMVIQHDSGARLDEISLKLLGLLPLLSLCFMFPTMLSFWHTSTGPAVAIIGLGLVALVGVELIGLSPVWAYCCLAGGFGLQQAAYRRRIRLPSNRSEISQAQSDHDFLRGAFNWTLLGMVGQLFESAGERQAAAIESQFNQYAQAAGWQIQVHRDQLEDALPQTASLSQLGATYAACLTLLLDLIAHHMGEKMTARALQRVYDSLSWEEREIASHYLFPEVKRAQTFSRLFHSTQQNYRALLRRNMLFISLSETEIDHLCTRLKVEKFAPGQAIIRQGDRGDKFYIITTGSVEVDVRNAQGVSEIVNHLGRGDYFGQVALLNDAPRNATCRAAIPTEVVSLSRVDFEKLVKVCFELHEKLESSISRANLLRHIPIFAEMGDQKLHLICAHLGEESYEPGTTVIHQGETGDKFYVIESGWVQVLVETDCGEQMVSELGPGEYFGEISLLLQNRRSATVRVIAPACLLTLDKSGFERLVAPQLYGSQVLEQEVSRRILITHRVGQSQSGNLVYHGG